MSMARPAVDQGLPPPDGGPAAPERPTRKPLAFWDRIKFLVLLIVVWFVLAWSLMANDPLVGFSDALRTEVRTGWWVFLLIGLEFLRQVHFVISEHSASYHRFWTWTVFGGFERITHRRLSDWDEVPHLAPAGLGLLDRVDRLPDRPLRPHPAAAGGDPRPRRDLAPAAVRGPAGPHRLPGASCSSPPSPLHPDPGPLESPLRFYAIDARDDEGPAP